MVKSDFLKIKNMYSHPEEILHSKFHVDIAKIATCILYYYYYYNNNNN